MYPVAPGYASHATVGVSSVVTLAVAGEERVTRDTVKETSSLMNFMPGAVVHSDLTTQSPAAKATFFVQLPSARESPLAFSAQVAPDALRSKNLTIFPFT